MAHIVGKKISGQTYYYLREMARVDGKPKVVSQTYLGKANDIAAAVAASGPTGIEPERSRHLAFGDLAAVWSVLDRLGVIEIIDQAAGTRRADAAASVGTYLALAITNRVVDPRSKRGFADWWATTAGSGTRWTAWTRTRCAPPSGRSPPPWSVSLGWTYRGWRWT